jgi:hypothetical protein
MWRKRASLAKTGGRKGAMRSWFSDLEAMDFKKKDFTMKLTQVRRKPSEYGLIRFVFFVVSFS